MTGHIPRVALGRTAILSLLAALALAAPADAQLGGLLKKAKKAVTQQDPNAGPASGSPLTAPVIEAVLAGLRAERPILTERDKLSDERDALRNEQNRLTANKDDQIQAYQEAEQKNDLCVGEAFDRIQEDVNAKMAAYGQTLVSDPARLMQFQQDLAAMQQKVTALMQKGDTIGAYKAQMDFATTKAGVVYDPKADSVRAQKECGTPPTKPDWLAKADADRDRADTLATRIQALESKAGQEGVRASGLTGEQFLASRERIAMWYGRRSDKDGARGFTAAEVEALRAREAEIEKVADIL